MAAVEREETEFAWPDARALLRRAQAPWLASVRERLAALQDQGRLPHGILIAGAPGAGQAELGAWIGTRLLCRARDVCGKCADCRLILAGSHPDFRWVAVPADKKDIGIDQVRALSEALFLRSFRGGAKIAVISVAESMNRHSFNALLKTLEEPPSDTYLVLATGRIDRIPRTIVSRCQKIRVPLPPENEALAWLERIARRGDWPALLALAGGAPFLAEDYAAQDLGTIDHEMQDLVATAAAGRLDFVAAADRCAKDAPAARLEWLESWLTRSLKEAALASDLVNNNRLPWLRGPGADTKIRAAFGLLDQLRDARRQVGGSLNTQLLFEGLLVSVAGVLGGRRESRGT
jgi:DNA polymerase-3 subunit delta'